MLIGNCRYRKERFGRKCHLLVDTEDFLQAVRVHAADIQDRDGGRLLLADGPDRYPRMKHVWVEGAYVGTFADWINAHGGWSVQVIKLSMPHRFQVHPRRWMVGRTFSWISRYRRLSRDFEGRCDTSEALIQVALSRLMLARLSKLTG